MLGTPAERARDSTALTTCTVDTNLPCVRCSYNLHTRPVDGACPECGTAVAKSFPPTGFRYRTAGAAVRTQRGLALLVTAVFAGSLGYLYYWLVLRLSFALPPLAFRWACLAYGLLGAGIHLAAALGIACVVFPYGRRGDRFLQPLGIVTLVLVVAGTLPTVLDVYGQLTREVVYMRSATWTATYGALAGAFGAAHTLLWVMLLLRVRRTRRPAVWCTVAVVLVLDAQVLALELWQWVYFLRTTTISGGFITTVTSGSMPRMLTWYDTWYFEINRGVQLLTLLALWLYWRQLSNALAGRGDAFEAWRRWIEEKLQRSDAEAP